MIELLGVGVPRSSEGWLLRRVGVRIERERTVVVSRRSDEREAFLDVIAGRCVPSEGRAWVAGLPVMPATARRLHRLVADPCRPGGDGSITPAARLPRDIALTLRADHEILLLRDVDIGVTAAEMRRVLMVAEVLQRVRRLDVVISMADLECARRHAERLIVLDQGEVVFDAAPGHPPALHARERRGAASLT